MSKGTPLRCFRIDDDLWTSAKAKAELTGINLSDVVRDSLRRFLAEPNSGTNLRESSSPGP